MNGMKNGRNIRLIWAFAWCAAAVVLAAGPLSAMSKIIIVPTARTIGAGRYQLSLDRKAPLLDGSLRTLDMSVKEAIGERIQIETKVPISSGSGGEVLFYGKYTFALADDERIAAAVGIENAGSGKKAIPYIVFSRMFEPADVTVGVAKGSDSQAKFFTGLDYMTSDRMHLLADYNTGNKHYASAGFDYRFSRQWSLKSGIEVPSNERSDLIIKITYSGNYR
jgi:hypothetical protein